MGSTDRPTELIRLEALRSYEVLDSPPEDALDDIAKLAAQVCRTPMAVVSAVDAERVWFKARVGLELREAPREGAFCSYTIRGRDLFIVPDAGVDPRFARNPLVTGPLGVRFYAGSPLVTAEGPALGTLCVFDLVARDLAPEQAEALRRLARQAMTQIELRRALSAARKAESALQEGTERSMRQEAALVALSRSVVEADSLEEAIRRIVRTVADTLQVQRANGWRYARDRNTLRCMVSYDRTTETYSNDSELLALQYPRYFDALQKNEVIAATEARSDPRTEELAEDYLVPLGITSMMDAPVFVGSALEGVLCQEQVGPPRTWTEDEKLFVVGAAALMSLAIEQWERRRAEEALERSEERRVLAEETARGRHSFERLVGRSAPMQEVYRRLRLAAQSDVTVILTGESGTGKELAASAVHSLSGRRDKPFVAVNCAAIPEALLESELFGHVKGAFTGAVRDKIGLFQAAHGGTLFLDEVGEMSPSIQVKVLRALQEREVRRVGDERAIKVNVRLLAATNRDLKSLVDSGELRPDFYYRVAVFPIELPPLRERREDILLLTNHFIQEFSKARRRNITGVAPAALRALMNYGWPGNVRELRNAIEHSFVTISCDTLSLSDLPQEIIQSTSEEVPSGSEEDLKRRIQEALSQCGGSKAHAAKLLGVSRVTLWKWMKKLDMVNGQH